MSNDDNIDTLNDLIETCKDGEYGFRASAEYVGSPTTRQSFERRAEECLQAAGELQAIVVRLGGKAEDSAMAAYRKALSEPLPPDVRMVVERQFEGVKRNHLEVRTLRDQARAAAL